MKKKTIFIVLIVFGVFLAIGILPIMFFLRTNRSYLSVEPNYDNSFVGEASPEYMLAQKGDAYDSGTLTQDEMVNNQEGSKVQKNGSMSFLVEDLDKAVESMKIVNGKYFGQITNIYDSGRGNDRVVQITVKVPVEEFETYYEELRELDGEVTYANISTLDVTEEYIDITSRLSNLRNTEAQFTKILEQADTVTDILAVQRELNTVRGQIESYEQRKRYFDSQTDYSHITVTFSIDKTGISITDEQWKPLGVVKEAVKALLGVLKGFVNLIIWLVIFSPLVLIPYFVIKYLVRRKKTLK